MIPPESLADLPDGELWRRSRTLDTAEDDAARFLDLAGFADGLLDTDDCERVAASLADDPAAAADVAAARILSADDATHGLVPAAVAARAATLVKPAAAEIVPFAPRRGGRAGLPELARWTSLAAAVVFASWLGFTLGMDTSNSFGFGGRNGDDGALNELVDPSTSLMRDLTESSQT